MSRRWTEADLPPLGGKVIVVTGANKGLGLATTQALVRRGATVVMACRNEQRARSAVAVIDGPGEAIVMVCNLGRLQSVREFVDAFAARFDGCDVLCNNAGLMALPFAATDDGFEQQLGVNHLGHSALTGLMLPRLLARKGSRVVTVSSALHRQGRMAFDDLQSANGYQPWRAYCQSKLANLLFHYELQRRITDAGVDMLAVACHPGYAATDLQTSWTQGRALLGGLAKLSAGLVAQSPAMGALPSLYACAAPEVKGGDFIGPDGIRQFRGYPTVVESSRRARDREAAKRLWEVSEDLTDVTYAFGPAT